MLAAYASRLAEPKAFGGTAVRARTKVPCIPDVCGGPCAHVFCSGLIQKEGKPWWAPARRGVRLLWAAGG